MASGRRFSPLASWREWARSFEREAYALLWAWRDRRTPWYARVVAFITLAHTFSPIDLIPDFIPVLGQLDDLLITPLGLWLAVRLIPAEVMEEARYKAALGELEREKWRRRGVWAVIGFWALLLAVLISVLWDGG